MRLVWLAAVLVILLVRSVVAGMFGDLGRSDSDDLGRSDSDTDENPT